MEPLHALIQKSTNFIWDESQESEFEQLKECMTTAPMLEIFNNSNDTEHKVHTDASTKVLGAVLLQKRATEASFHPVVYFSRKLNNCIVKLFHHWQRNACYSRESQAFPSILTWNKICHMYQSSTADVFLFVAQSVSTTIAMGWLISQFFALVHNLVSKGNANIVPDRLSRWPDYLHTITMTMTVPELLDCLCVAQEHDTALQKYWLLARSTHPDYSIIYNSTGEFLIFKGRLYVPKNLVPIILYEYHDTRGHFGQ